LAAKRNILKVEPFDNLTVMCISTALRDYALAWHINEKLGIQLNRKDDLVTGNELIESGFSFYYYDQGENENIFNLIGNNSDGNLLLKLPLRTDYFLIVRNKISESRLTQIASELRLIPGVLHAYQLDLSKHKQVDIILEEIEFHEMNTLKRNQKRIPRN